MQESIRLPLVLWLALRDEPTGTLVPAGSSGTWFPDVSKLGVLVSILNPGSAGELTSGEIVAEPPQMGQGQEEELMPPPQGHSWLLLRGLWGRCRQKGELVEASFLGLQGCVLRITQVESPFTPGLDPRSRS